MNKSTVKIQERSRTDLRHDEVDGHLLVGENVENLRGCWRWFFKFSELSNSAAARKAELGL